MKNDAKTPKTKKGTIWDVGEEYVGGRYAGKHQVIGTPFRNNTFWPYNISTQNIKTPPPNTHKRQHLKFQKQNEQSSTTSKYTREA